MCSYLVFGIEFFSLKKCILLSTNATIVSVYWVLGTPSFQDSYDILHTTVLGHCESATGVVLENLSFLEFSMLFLYD